MGTTRFTRFGVCTALVLFACSQGRDVDRQSADRSAAAARKPAPFDKGPVKIALVQYSGAGDYFQQWTEGARSRPTRSASPCSSTMRRPTMPNRPPT